MNDLVYQIQLSPNNKSNVVHVERFSSCNERDTLRWNEVVWDEHLGEEEKCCEIVLEMPRQIFNSLYS